MHGCIDHHQDLTDFSVNELDSLQYRQLVQLVDRYFAAGYSYFTTMALHFSDQKRMQRKYDENVGQIS